MNGAGNRTKKVDHPPKPDILFEDFACYRRESSRDIDYQGQSIEWVAQGYDEYGELHIKSGRDSAEAISKVYESARETKKFRQSSPIEQLEILCGKDNLDQKELKRVMQLVIKELKDQREELDGHSTAYFVEHGHHPLKYSCGPR